MTKNNIPAKSTTGRKSHENKKPHASNTSASYTNHTQSEVVVSVTVQKASIDSKMLTPEQRRLASLMNDKIDVTDLEKKINKIIELTGASI